MNLDAIDSKILAILENNSAISMKNLSKLIQKSPETTQYRVNRLYKRKILLRQHAIVDMSKFGYETYRVYIKWQQMTLQDKEKFYQYLETQENIWTIAKLHGKWDMAFFVGIKHSNEFQKVWSEIESLYKSNIAEYKIAIYSRIINYNKKFFSDTVAYDTIRQTGGNYQTSFDEVDKKILQLYGVDVTQPLHKIAKELGMSIETIRKRLQKLNREQAIVGYKIDVDLAKLGLQGYRVDFYLNSTKRNKEIREYIRQHPYFYQINESIGGADFETEIVTASLVHLLEELEKLAKLFKDVFRYYEYFGYTGFPKLSVVSD